MEHPNTPSSPIAELVARARAAQRIYETWSQAQVDTAVVAAGWAIIEPAHNRELAELAVKDTGVGNVEDKVRKNHRKTFGLLRDLHGARSVGVITEDPARGIVEIARPVGVVCAITPSTNPGATPANKIINALKGRNAVIVAPSPKGWSTAVRLIEFIHQQFDRIGAPRDLVQLLPAPVNKQSTAELMRLCDLVVATEIRQGGELNASSMLILISAAENQAVGQAWPFDGFLQKPIDGRALARLIGARPSH